MSTQVTSESAPSNNAAAAAATTSQDYPEITLLGPERPSAQTALALAELFSAAERQSVFTAPLLLGAAVSSASTAVPLLDAAELFALARTARA